MRSWVDGQQPEGCWEMQPTHLALQAGEYEDEVADNSKWETGDWNGDGEFDSADFVKAFQGGGFEEGPRAAESVPEPAGMTLVLLGVMGTRWIVRRRTNQ